ncbi:MAG: hypothetical protein ACI959_000606, partial [Limisphaerales bacterium]
ALWFPGLYFLIRTRKKNQILLASFLIPLVLYTATFIPFSNPIAHRYYLPVLILFIPWIVFQLSQLSIVRRNTIVGFAALLLISGHFWIYPDKVAQGWDGSLAHLPYFELRKAYLFDLEDEKDVFTDFPMNKTMWDSNPGYKNKGNYKAVGKVENSWLDFDYVVYSNIINDISEEEYDIITSSWILEKELKKGQVFIREYKNPNR